MLNTACSFWKFRHFPITPCSCEKRCQVLTAFLYCKWQKAGQGLRTRLLFFCICVLLATSGFTSSFVHVTTMNSYWISKVLCFYPSSRVSTTHHQENNCTERGQKNSAAWFGRSHFVDTGFFSAIYPLSKLELENRPHVYNCRSSEYSTTSLHPEVQLVPLTSAPILSHACTMWHT